MDFFNGQVNQHTSDLGCFVLSSDLLHVLIDDLTYLGFVVGVLGHDGGKDL